MTTDEVKEAAYLKADRINDLMGVRSEAYRKHNRLSWAAQDMETLGMEGWQDLTREAYKVLSGK
ncbi:hypothetical protein LCGC14_1776840 [marine sediment metagenome]|uniref:Uncharacterized protein n=1 Tax=marine sediment metagenome TaxID=412755 RepID=A0A0F9JW97_9ZZZZ